MLQSTYKSYDELPLFLNAEQLADALGVSASVAYALLHDKEFPTLKVGMRYVVPKDKFLAWIGEHTTI